MMKFPYGMADFNRIIREGYFYIDRTASIAVIEEAGEQLLFLRPRRFGKSLWLSTLDNYYDLARAHQFEQLFGHLAIGKNPTPNHNRYFILKWNFSVVDASGNTDEITRNVHQANNAAIFAFNLYYRNYLPGTVPIHEENSLVSFSNLVATTAAVGHPLYLLIDEYDNFANEVIASRNQGQTRYYELVHGEGIIKTVFKAIKAASEGSGLERVFITGVAPLVISDITSGYNVVENVGHLPRLHSLCGFTEEEVLATNRQIAHACHLANAAADEAMVMMRNFYNGYRFISDTNEKLYNPTLSLYFFKAWQRDCHYPAQMLDSNLAMDKNRINYIASLPHGSELINQLTVLSEPVMVDELHPSFGLESLFDTPPDNSWLLSLLTYFGVLTIAGHNQLGQLQLTIPNQVIQSLYVERLKNNVINSYEDREMRRQVADHFYIGGDLAPLAKFIEQCFLPSLSNRDLRWSNELVPKVTLLTLLMNTLYYSIRSELGVGRGYSDLLLEVRPDKRQTPLLDHLFELKYLPLKSVKLNNAELDKLDDSALAGLSAVKIVLDEAEKQLADYLPTLKQQNPAVSWKLCTHALVMIGLSRVAWRSQVY